MNGCAGLFQGIVGFWHVNCYKVSFQSLLCVVCVGASRKDAVEIGRVVRYSSIKHQKATN